MEAFPSAIHTVLTDNGVAFAEQPRYRGGFSDSWGDGHIFERVCRQHDIDHRLTKPYHPWTNGQAERMNRTVKEATIKAFHSASWATRRQGRLRARLDVFTCAPRPIAPQRWQRPKTGFVAVHDS